MLSCDGVQLRLPAVRLTLTALQRRTLLYGGLAMNPRSHLRLVYEANPLAFLAEQARTSTAHAERNFLG